MYVLGILYQGIYMIVSLLRCGQKYVEAYTSSKAAAPDHEERAVFRGCLGKIYVINTVFTYTDYQRKIISMC